MDIVRLGTAKDVEDAVSVWRAAQAARRHGVPVLAEHEQRARRYLATSDAFFVVAESGGTVVGMALAMQARAERGRGPKLAGRCQLGLVSVYPNQAGRGIAKRMYILLLTEAIARGYSSAQTWTQVDNFAAKRLYEAFGLVPTGLEMDDEVRGRMMQYELALLGLNHPLLQPMR